MESIKFTPPDIENSIAYRFGNIQATLDGIARDLSNTLDSQKASEESLRILLMSIEQRVAELERWRWKILGAIALLALCIPVLAELIKFVITGDL